MKSQIKNKLPIGLVNRIRRVIFLIKDFLGTWLGRTRWGSALYYFLFDHQFYREQHSSLAGKHAYLKASGISDKTSALLRRNTHRIEKGLIMKPRKAVFAESYIDETVACFAHCLQSSSIESCELKWAQDVLNKYFSVVDTQQSEVILVAQQKFDQLPLVAESDVSYTPYQFSEREVSDITQKQLHQLFKQRRSVRWFQQKAVSKQLIEQCVEMALQAPSACNRQPFEFYTFTTPSRAAEIAAIPMGTKGFANNIQALIVIVGDLSAYAKERDRHVIYIDGGLVAMQLMLAFESLGLSTCPINWPDMEAYEKIMAKELALKSYQRPIMLMAIGYGEQAGKIPYSKKKSAQQVIKEMD